MATKLKYSEVPKYRELYLTQQGGLCALCGLPITKQPVLDHCHTNGHLRGTLHNGCNALLGKLENNYKRYGVLDLHRFLAGAGSYLHRTSALDTPLHPTFKTYEEKQAKARATAKARREKAQGPDL